MLQKDCQITSVNRPLRIQSYVNFFPFVTQMCDVTLQHLLVLLRFFQVLRTRFARQHVK